MVYDVKMIYGKSMVKVSLPSGYLFQDGHKVSWNCKQRQRHWDGGRVILSRWNIQRAEYFPIYGIQMKKVWGGGHPKQSPSYMQMEFIKESHQGEEQTPSPTWPSVRPAACRECTGSSTAGRETTGVNSINHFQFVQMWFHCKLSYKYMFA